MEMSETCTWLALPISLELFQRRIQLAFKARQRVRRVLALVLCHSGVGGTPVAIGASLFEFARAICQCAAEYRQARRIV